MLLPKGANPLGLTPLEVASGRPLGGASLELPEPDPGGPRAALERRLRQELARGRCVVALSGGRDSSVVLAVAAAVARREGLALPAAVSLSFPGRFGDEAEWQELVVRAAAIDDWERVEVGEELDLVGPLAAAALRRHGLLFPPHAHLYAPVLERARGGTVLTGIGGDNAVDGWRFQRLAQAARGRRRPTREDSRSLALWMAPHRLRRRLLARGSRAAPSWLTDEARRWWLGQHAEAEAGWPRRWPAAVALATGGRRLAVAQAGLDLLAAAAGARIAHPLLDPAWLAAIAASGSAAGPGGRERLWPRLFADVLPVPLAARAVKAVYDGVYFTGPSRRFTEAWDGRGLHGGVVDPGRLRATWRDPWRAHLPGTLQQALWLARL